MKRLSIFFCFVLIFISTTISNAETAAKPTYVNRHYFENGSHELRPIIINNNTTWTKANSPYLIESAIKINPGGILNIEEGVRVLFSNETRSLPGIINVSEGGNLIVSGKLGQEVLFAPYSENSQATFNWTSIDIFGKSNINYGVFENGSGINTNSGSINIHSNEVIIDNSLIRTSTGNGISIFGEIKPTIQNSKFKDLKGYAIYQDSINADPYFSNLSTDNLNKSIKIQTHVDYSIGDPINREITWEDPSIPYIIDGWVYIENNGVLNISPNVKVKFNPINTPKKGSIIVKDKGKLYADEVSFSSNEYIEGRHVMNWDYIHGQSGSTVEIRNSDITNGGYCLKGEESSKLGSLIIDTQNAIIKNTTISDGDSHGIYLGKADISPTLEDITIRNNRGYGIYLKENAKPWYKNISQRFNDRDGVFLESKTLIDYTKWGKTEGPYYLKGNYNVVENSTLKVEPGTRIYFDYISEDEKSSIKVFPNSKILASGTLSSPILFSSSNKNPLPGDWDNIDILKDASGRFDYCNFEYGGNSNYGMLNISSNNVSVTHSYFANSKRSAINIAEGVAPYEISKNQFNLNSESFGIYKWDNDINVNAINNWWNHVTGPYNSILNPGGRGTMVSDSIKFKPYQTTPSNFIENISSLTPKYNVPIDKVWTVKFNNKLNKSYVNTSYVNVIDSNGNIIEIDVKLSEASNEIIVTPISNYSTREKYTLIIKQGIQDISNKELSNTLKMDFHIN